MRPIDADAFRKVLSEWEMKYDRRRTFDEFAYGATSAYEHAGDLLDEMPTIKTFTLADIEEQYRKGLEKGLEEAERQHGEWKQVTAKDGEYYCYHKCTNCGQTIESGFDNPPIFNFCPNCGADMRKEGETK